MKRQQAAVVPLYGGFVIINFLYGFRVYNIHICIKIHGSPLLFISSFVDRMHINICIYFKTFNLNQLAFSNGIQNQKSTESHSICKQLNWLNVLIHILHKIYVCTLYNIHVTVV